jgi:hypothetical protein
VQKYSVSVSFLLHYFSAPSEQFLPKELSQIFAPIPGARHATTTAEHIMPVMVPIWRSMPAYSKNNTALGYVSNFKAVLRNFPDFSTPIPAATWDDFE